MGVEELLEKYKTLDHDDKIAFIHKVRLDNREKERKELEKLSRELEKNMLGIATNGNRCAASMK